MKKGDFDWVLNLCYGNSHAMYFEHQYEGRYAYSIRDLFGHQITDWGKLLSFVYRVSSKLSYYKILLISFDLMDTLAVKAGYEKYEEFQDKMVKKGYYPV